MIQVFDKYNRNESTVGAESFETVNEQVKFIDVTLSEESVLKKKRGLHNFVFFVLSGALSITEQKRHQLENHMPAGYFAVLSCDQECELKVVEEVHLVVLQFISITEPENINFFQGLSKKKLDYDYKFTPLAMNFRLEELIHLISDGLKSGLGCMPFHAYCEGLLFVLLRNMYEEGEIIQALYNIIGRRMDFRNKVLHNYNEIHSVQQFASEFGMSKNTFMKTFREEFGVKFKKWLLDKKKDSILLHLSDTTITVKELMFRCGFDTPSNFTRFFKRNFHCTPTFAIANKYEVIRDNIHSSDLEMDDPRRTVLLGH
jgi:AraC-like DNA-binding protein